MKYLILKIASFQVFAPVTMVLIIVGYDAVQMDIQLFNFRDNVGILS
jgi:hypothetical protein